MRTLRIIAAAVALAAIPAALASADAVRTVVSSTPASGAPGYMLDLYKVDIPAGTVLPLHYHPGSQVSRIMRGVLRYTVVKGYAYETTPNPVAGGAPAMAKIKQGQTVNIEAGHGLVEPRGMQHTASAPKGPVMVMLSILRPKDQPATIVVTP